MGLSRLSEKCRKCPFVDKCNHKRMEALTYLPEPQIAMNVAQSAGIDAAQPLLRETMTIHIAGKPVVVYKDEIEKQLYSHWLPSKEVADILYLCDGKQCGDSCPSTECKHTSDITHAKNFIKGDYDSYWEKEKRDSNEPK